MRAVRFREANLLGATLDGTRGEPPMFEDVTGP
nr:hypothetical protein [Polyangium jinanense]